MLTAKELRTIADERKHWRSINNERAPHYINLYRVTRCYGGPEEGGWWYDYYELEYTSKAYPNRYIARKKVDVAAICDRHNIDPSCLEMRIETGRGASQTVNTPYYC